MQPRLYHYVRGSTHFPMDSAFRAAAHALWQVCYQNTKNGFGISCDRNEYLAVMPIHKSGPCCLYLLLTQAYDHLINILSKT